MSDLHFSLLAAIHIQCKTYLLSSIFMAFPYPAILVLYSDISLQETFTVTTLSPMFTPKVSFSFLSLVISVLELLFRWSVMELLYLYLSPDHNHIVLKTTWPQLWPSLHLFVLCHFTLHCHSLFLLPWVYWSVMCSIDKENKSKKTEVQSGTYILNTFSRMVVVVIAWKQLERVLLLHFKL